MSHASVATRSGRWGALLSALALAAAGLSVAAAPPAHAASGPLGYVANFASNTVSVIDTGTNTAVATIPVDDGPVGVAIAPNGHAVYVANQGNSGGAGLAAGGNSVSVIDTATNTVTTTVPVGNAPLGIAVTPSGGAVYVTNKSSNTVSVIDTATNAVTATIPVGAGPADVAISPSGATAYVTNLFGDTVSVISTAGNTVTATVPVGSQPVGVAINPAGTAAYVANHGPNTVSVIDTASNTVTASVGVGSSPQDLVVTPSGDAVYVANTGGNSVSVISAATNTVTATIGGLGGPVGIAVNPAGTAVYAANENHNTVSVISTATNTATAGIGVGSVPIALAITPQAAPAPPTVGGVSPNTGPVAGGSAVTVTGTGFTGATGVAFGATAAASFTVNSDTSITATAPAATASGAVDVTVTTAAGTSATAPADQYAYTKDATSLTAQPLLFSLSGGLNITLHPQATLTDTTTGKPVPGQTITFTVGTHTVCTATTNAQGVASCAGLCPLTAILLSGSYTATFAGTPALAPATATAGLIQL
ncbi:IPT/TIG domain-containing protein [Kitasatospora sp. NPDC059673]|uniref:IPT/TIG domain-containing protein n=1 Tax=Kitasatospora sp. NPDC059673 TaxID=3346901 RepID=UPI0036B87081